MSIWDMVADMFIVWFVVCVFCLNSWAFGQCGRLLTFYVVFVCVLGLLEVFGECCTYCGCFLLFIWGVVADVFGTVVV